jgi:hypothetical protein
LKTRVTVSIKALAALKEQGELTLDVYEEARLIMKDRTDAVEKLNCVINDAILEDEECSDEALEREMAEQETVVQFICEILCITPTIAGKYDV